MIFRVYYFFNENFNNSPAQEPHSMIRAASQKAVETLRDFFLLESAGGLLLIGAAAFSTNLDLPSFLHEDWFRGIVALIGVYLIIKK